MQNILIQNKDLLYSLPFNAKVQKSPMSALQTSGEWRLKPQKMQSFVHIALLNGTGILKSSKLNINGQLNRNKFVEDRRLKLSSLSGKKDSYVFNTLFSLTHLKVHMVK